MSKVFTAQEFVDKCKWFTTLPNVYYSGKDWSTLNSNGQWRNDCVLSVKSLLWGFSADKNKFRGGTVYKSNGVADFSCNGALSYCTNISTNFENLTIGEYLCMKGLKSEGKEVNHTGIYLGNGKVFEDTSCRAWGVKKAIISDIDSKGIRSYKGVKCLRWTYHAKLIYIDYTNAPVPMGQVAILQSTMNKQWNCGLDVDNSFGPKTREQCRKHQLTYGINAPIMVKWLQSRLKELGYDTIKIDGSFGPDTKKKVIQFQKSKHLNPDAIVGENTYKALTE